MSDRADAPTTLPLEVFGHPNGDTLLLWHAPGATTAETAEVASRLGGRGRRVVVPTWTDGRDLLRSVRYARETAVHPPDQLALVGYGAAGVAALSLALHQRRLGIELAEVSCVGAAGQPDPISGRPLDAPVTPKAPTRVALVPGADPESREWTRRTADAWRAAGWPVQMDAGPSAPA